MTAIANLLPTPFAPTVLLPAERAAIVKAATASKAQLEHPRMPSLLANVLRHYHGAVAGQMVEHLRSTRQVGEEGESPRETDLLIRGVHILLQALAEPAHHFDLLEGGKMRQVTNIAFTKACFSAMQALADGYANIFRTAQFALSRHLDDTGVNAFHPWINRGVQRLHQEGPHLRHVGPAPDTLVSDAQRITTSGPITLTNIPTHDFRRLANTTGGPFTAWRQRRYDDVGLAPWPLHRGDQTSAMFHFDEVGTWHVQCTRTNSPDDRVTVQIMAKAVGNLAEPDTESAADIGRILLERAEVFLAGALDCLQHPEWARAVGPLKGTDAWPKGFVEWLLDRVVR